MTWQCFRGSTGLEVKIAEHIKGVPKKCKWTHTDIPYNYNEWSLWIRQNICVKILDSPSDLCNVICSMLPFRSNLKLDLRLLLLGLFFTHCLLQDFTETAFLEEMCCCFPQTQYPSHLHMFSFFSSFPVFGNAGTPFSCGVSKSWDRSENGRILQMPRSEN